MRRVRLDSMARADLVDIAAYIAKDNRSAARRLMKTLRERFRMLASSPLLGEARPELAPHLRAFVVGNYVIFYRPTSDGVEIARVIHGARDLPRQF